MKFHYFNGIGSRIYILLQLAVRIIKLVYMTAHCAVPQFLSCYACSVFR